MSVKTGIFCLLTLVFLSCNRSTQPTALVATKQPESFNVFFDQFNTDSTFQRSRVVFPLDYYSVTEESTDYELINQPINTSNYLILDLTYNDSFAKREFDAYKRIIQTKKDTTWVKFTGVDNGIHEEFIFARRKGKWFLVKVTDGST
jgi:Domain of unknown function (DUF4348)